jgi:UDP-N-acetyl-D-mannosaminuronic acid dehydrogenase
MSESAFSNDVTVVGTGRVGLPLALSLLDKGLRVDGIDVDPVLIEAVARRQMPFKEPGYQEILDRKSFELGEDYAKLSASRYVVITVGTPLEKHVETDLSSIKQVLDRSAPHLRRGQTVILRSTVTPGTTGYVRRYLEKITGYRVGHGLFLAFCPERIAEGKAREELETLPQIIGTEENESAERAERLFKVLVDDILHTNYRSAELAKLFSNISRYIYFAVANQFLMLADEFDANIFEILEMTNYKYPRQIVAKPGLTGGACLRKDFGMLNEHIPYMDLLLGAWKVNESVPRFLVSQLARRTSLEDRVITVLGYTFKQDSDDTRDSLSPKLVRYLERHVPREIRIAEPNLSVGAALEGGYTNHDVVESVRGAGAVFVAVNHSAFAQGLGEILEAARPDTWFSDIWGVTGTGKAFFQRMEISTCHASSSPVLLASSPAT